MNEPSEIKNGKEGLEFSQQIAASAKRKLSAQRKGAQGVWFGLGMMGLISWSVVVPTLFGAALGGCLDNRHPGVYSWTLTLMIIGLAIGCLNAWHWLEKEDSEMQKEQEDSNE